MIVYRERRPAYNTAAVLDRIERASDSVSHALIVDFGELEAGLADVLCPARDSDCAILGRLREAAIALARSFWHRRLGSGRHRYWLERFRRGVISLRHEPLPKAFQAAVPEGFAYYALYPELYCESARRFAAERSRGLAAVIGIRSIGAPLSAAVAAVLHESGWRVGSWTVRPRGHPFDRRLTIAPDLEDCWKSLSAASFLIVDEGPGLSGSSLASAARYFSSLGVPDERIVLFPAWLPDGSAFLSRSAQEQWRRHSKYCTSFEELWPFEGDVELSAGKWRGLLFEDERFYPAVQIQHERRKYLRRNGAETLHKFAGLGHYGAAKSARAVCLAEAGFIPEPLSLENGFLATRFLPGSPAPPVTKELLDRMAAYLDYLGRTQAGGEEAPWSDLMEMIELNVAEGLGTEWKDRLAGLQRSQEALRHNSAVAIDGRMLPHEWIQTPSGYMKTDGLDHHSDHFFPGPQDIAWDAAGAIAEFGLDAAGAEYFLNTLAALLGDSGLFRRLPFYSVAYLSFRLGYTSMASESLGGSADGIRFRGLRQRYAAALRRQLEALSPHV